MRWQQVFGYEQVVSDVGHPETKIRYASSLVWLVDHGVGMLGFFCPVCVAVRFVVAVCLTECGALGVLQWVRCCSEIPLFLQFLWAVCHTSVLQ